MFDLIFLGILGAIVGGRIVYCLFNYQEFGVQIWKWLAIWYHPGYHWLGEILGYMIVFIRYCKKKRWDVFKVLDIAALGLSIAAAVTSLATFLEGGGLGRQTKWFIGVSTSTVSEKRIPVGLFGFFLWLVVFGFLWWAEGKYRKFEWYQRFRGDSRPGFLYFSYLIGFGMVGIILEALSEPVYWWLGVDVDILMKLGLVLIGALGIYFRSGLSVNVDWEKFKIWKKKSRPAKRWGR
jgi:phosphatidylglycerol:prolipoprotein diacylglycerol transferase